MVGRRGGRDWDRQTLAGTLREILEDAMEPGNQRFMAGVEG